jgi:ubiquinone/menaquinone biosynthesis C-methylase UbiE
MKQATVVTPEKLIDDLWLARGTQAVIAGIELAVFTHIAAGKRTAAEIAKAARSNEAATRRLLDALVALGYLNRRGTNYGLEPVARAFLVRTEPAYLGDFANETKMLWNNWGRLAEVVKAGKPLERVDDPGHGAEFFTQLVSAIFPLSFGAGQAAAAALPAKRRGRIKEILDVAAGAAPWSIAFALAAPKARVTVVEVPEVAKVARQFTKRFGVADRFGYLEGDLRKVDLGKDRYDLVILGHIIHSEGQKWGRKLIQRAHRALRSGGLLLIAEIIPNDARSGPPIPLLFSLNMLLHTTEGDVFTMKQYKSWLKEAGFKKVATIPAPSPSPLILATK